MTLRPFSRNRRLERARIMANSLTKDTALQAVDLSFAAHVERLFVTLVSGLNNEDDMTSSESAKQFQKQFRIAKHAHQIMSDHVNKVMT